MLHPEIEMLDREGILRLQQDRLAALGKRLGQSEAWRAHFNAAGMQPEDLAAPDGLQNAPFMEKAQLRDHYPFPFLTVPVEEVERFVATSGTTGLPVLFGMTREDFGTL
ncbi:MAG: phenylacetate--CoA ligase, partial [Pseudodonghicola sp.]